MSITRSKAKRIKLELIGDSSGSTEDIDSDCKPEFETEVNTELKEEIKSEIKSELEIQFKDEFKPKIEIKFEDKPEIKSESDECDNEDINGMVEDQETSEDIEYDNINYMAAEEADNRGVSRDSEHIEEVDNRVISEDSNDIKEVDSRGFSADSRNTEILVDNQEIIEVLEEDNRVVTEDEVIEVENYTIDGYRRNSFERFDENLVEKLFKVFNIVYRFRYECVSKKWQKLIFCEQKRLNFSILNKKLFSRNIHPVRSDTFELIPKSERIKCLVKKCRFVETIYLDETWFITPDFFDIICKSKLDLKTFRCEGRATALTQTALNGFGKRFLNTLEYFHIKDMTDDRLRVFLTANRLPKLKNIEFSDEEMTDICKLVVKNNLFGLKHIKFPFRTFTGLNMFVNKLWERIEKIDIVLNTDTRSLLKAGMNKALLVLSRLENVEWFTLRAFSEDTIITACDEGLEAIANNCQRIKHLDFTFDCLEINGRIFDLFGKYRNLEYMELSVEFNRETIDYGRFESLRECLFLKVLNLYLFNLNEEVFKDIHQIIPNLENFHIRCDKGITDQTLDYLTKCPKLKVLEVHTFSDDESVLNITDKGITNLIDCCPRMTNILLFTRTRGVGARSVLHFRDKANKCVDQSVMHFIGLVNMREIFLTQIDKNSVHFHPNLTLVQFPESSFVNYIETARKSFPIPPFPYGSGVNSGPRLTSRRSLNAAPISSGSGVNSGQGKSAPESLQLPQFSDVSAIKTEPGTSAPDSGLLPPLLRQWQERQLASQQP